MKRFKIGLISRMDEKSIKIVKLISEKLRSLNHEVFYESELAKILNKKEKLNYSLKYDFIIWVGGDGTLLKFVNKLVNSNAKFLGIKRGKVGFLCETTPLKLEETLKKILSNDFKIEKRKLLEIAFKNKKYYCLNEIYFCGLNIGKTSKFIAKKNKEEIFNGRCDGVIISTSLGSTAYIASRGGAIIDPELDILIFDPLNPLKWGSRQIILPFKSEITVSSTEKFLAIIDGNIKLQVKEKGKVKIKGSQKTISFVRFTNNFYRKIKLRSTLNV